jgi:hypothetical protein
MEAVSRVWMQQATEIQEILPRLGLILHSIFWELTELQTVAIWQFIPSSPFRVFSIAIFPDPSAQFGLIQCFHSKAWS